MVDYAAHEDESMREQADAWLGFEPAAINSLGAALRARRDLFCDGLGKLGFTVHRPAATYFATTDIESVAPGQDAFEFCRALPERCGVVAIPSSVFYDPGDPGAGRTLVRWAFCKRVEVLEEALARLASWSCIRWDFLSQV